MELHDIIGKTIVSLQTEVGEGSDNIPFLKLNFHDGTDILIKPEFILKKVVSVESLRVISNDYD